MKAKFFTLALLLSVIPAGQVLAGEDKLDLQLSTTYERFTLPNNEKMGMANVRLS